MNEAVENLKLVLTSPRERKKGTISSYLSTAGIFLRWLGDNKIPTDKDFRLYFLWRRENGISERTLGKDFQHLKKLAIANKWPWGFTSEDRPVTEEEPLQTAFTLDEIEVLIKARNKLSSGEDFYLAISITWGLRAEDMIRVRKRDWDNDTIYLKVAKKGQWRRHLIPDEIKPILANYRPKLDTTRALTYMFHRIESKAGLPHREGYGWHSIRRSLETYLEWSLAKNELPLSYVADFMSWSKTRKGQTFHGALMPARYSHPEIILNDPYSVDRLVLPVHPFLPLYREKS